MWMFIIAVKVSDPNYSFRFSEQKIVNYGLAWESKGKLMRTGQHLSNPNLGVTLLNHLVPQA